ncbi:MAG: alkaline shock response membrane anchor protein AmaP [Firmicutes bacterium]|nr:alkaline shock response membrane anchor protein AmaP [Bacillota bacterium]
MNDYPQLFDLIQTGGPIFNPNPPATTELFNKYTSERLPAHALGQLAAVGKETKSARTKVYFMQQLLLTPLALFFMGVFIFLYYCLEFDYTFSEMYLFFPFMFWGLAVLLVISIACTVLFIIKFKNHRMKLQQSVSEDESQVEKLIQTHFNFPSDAAKIDIFQQTRNRRGKVLKMATKRKTIWAYQKDDFIYIAFLPFLLKIHKRDCLSAELAQGKNRYADPLTVMPYNELKEFGIKRSSVHYNNIIFYVALQFGRFMFQSGSDIFTIETLPYSYEAANKIFKSRL